MNFSKRMPVTIGLVLLALVVQFFWPKNHCDTLTNSLEDGYFLRWAEPQLLLIRSDKQTFTVNHADKETACLQLYQQLNP